jgi:hypothetical protein
MVALLSVARPPGWRAGVLLAAGGQRVLPVPAGRVVVADAAAVKRVLGPAAAVDLGFGRRGLRCGRLAVAGKLALLRVQAGELGLLATGQAQQGGAHAVLDVQADSA